MQNVIRVEDGKVIGGAPISEHNNMPQYKVIASVTADGVKNYRTLLSELYNLIHDKTFTFLIISINNMLYYNVSEYAGSGSIALSRTRGSTAEGGWNLYVDYLLLNNASDFLTFISRSTGTSTQNNASTVPSSGIVFKAITNEVVMTES